MIQVHAISRLINWSTPIHTPREPFSRVVLTLILVETIDTLNAKVALFAIDGRTRHRHANSHHDLRHHHSMHQAEPFQVKTTEAFCSSVRHAKPLTIGLNQVLTEGTPPISIRPVSHY